MKLQKIKLQNFAKFDNFEMEFDGKITRLVGMNGSGKTTVGLTALWAGLKGIAEKGNDQLVGDRYKFIGPSRASADIEITLLDVAADKKVVIRNHITAAGNQITFQSEPDYPISNAWVSNLLNVAFLSAKNFSLMTGKQQALALGIDVSEIDAKIREVKEEYTLLNRQLRQVGEIEAAEPATPVDVNELLAKRKVLSAKQDQVIQKKTEKSRYEQTIKSWEQNIADWRDQIKWLEESISEYQARCEKGRAAIQKLDKELQAVDVSKEIEEVEIQLQQAQDTNYRSQQYAAYLQRAAQAEELTVEIQRNRNRLDELQQQRLEWIKAFDFGYDQLSVSEDGELLLDGRRIAEPYFSKGELEIIVAKLYATLEPELRVRFIDDFELLDEGNQKKILDFLFERDFQVITAEVGEQSTKDNVVVLRECKIEKGKSKQSIV